MAEAPFPDVSPARPAEGQARRAQDRDAFFLILNTGAGAALGLLFWVLAARLAGAQDATIGIAYVIISLGTLAAVMAKGGLDTALLLHIPTAGRANRGPLLRLAFALSAATALATVAVFELIGRTSPAWRPLGLAGWGLVAVVAVLLGTGWLQDATLLAEGNARLGFVRNLVACFSRVALLVILIALGLPSAAVLAWTLALVIAALAGIWLGRRQGRPGGVPVPAPHFLRSAWHNLSSSVAELVPGLVLTPMVLALDGPASAAHFAMAWTAASLLFLGSAAIGRTALASMAGQPPTQQAHTIRRAALQLAVVILPAACVAFALAHFGLSILGKAYADEGTVALRILAASCLVVAPSYLLLAVLRAQQRRLLLWAIPASVALTLLIAAPVLGRQAGLAGVAWAWTFAHAPWGCYAVWRLRREGWGVNTHGTTAPLAGHPHAE